MKFERSEAYGTLGRSIKTYLLRCFGFAYSEAHAAADDLLGFCPAHPAGITRIDAGAHDRVASDG